MCSIKLLFLSEIYVDNSESIRQASTLKCRNALALSFTSPTHLYFFVALDICILLMQRACFLHKFKRSN